ncbi:MAG: hypothetical protein WC803_12825 [Sphingomonas sp.]|jgi:hypothetical protein
MKTTQEQILSQFIKEFTDYDGIDNVWKSDNPDRAVDFFIQSLQKVEQSVREEIAREVEELIVPTDKMKHDLRGSCDFEKNNTLQKVLYLISNK